MAKHDPGFRAVQTLGIGDRFEERPLRGVNVMSQKIEDTGLTTLWTR